MNVQNLKLLSLNFLSWIATAASLQALKEWLQIVAVLGSIGVSVASVWWIRRQAKSLDQRDSGKPSA